MRRPRSDPQSEGRPAPENITTTQIGYVDLAWTVPTDDGGQPITGYEYRFDRGAGFFQLLRELMSRIFGDQFPYLIPLGVIFIVMIIFLPQGLMGWARRWLNR